MRRSVAVMVIGVVGLSPTLVSTELLDSFVWIGLFVAEVVSVITEVIVVTEAITINRLFAVTTPIATVRHPSKHNIY